MVIQGSIETTLTISIIATLLGAMGFSLAFKDYIASFMAGLIIRRAKQINVGGRVKVLASPVVKGDVIEIGWFRTTLMEVGDGERLPSVQTGRIMKIPNFMLFNNPTLIYGDSLIDEVIAYIRNESTRPNSEIIENMAHAIESEGHKVIGIGLYQKENSLVVHGIFESTTRELIDVRSNILARYLDMMRLEIK